MRVRHHRSLGQELPHAPLHHARAQPAAPYLRGRPLRRNVTLDDAWALGFDHVALAAGAGRPTIIDMKNNLGARHPQGVRLPHGPAADRRLQEELAREPARAAARGRDRRRPHRHRHRHRAPRVLSGPAREGRDAHPSPHRGEGRRGRSQDVDDEEWGQLQVQLRTPASSKRSATSRPAKAATRASSRCSRSGAGSRLVYRRSVLESPAYRLNHEEVQQSLQEGVALRRRARADRGRPRHDGPHQGREVRAPRRRPRRGRAPGAHAVASPRARAPTPMYEKEYEGTSRSMRRSSTSRSTTRRSTART